jgi:hypothetical protein
MKNKKSILLSLLLGLGFALFFTMNLGKKKTGPMDVVNKENSKIGVFFEELLEDEKDRIKMGFYDGLLPSSVSRIDEYLKTIQTIESYASKGTESDDKFNKIEIRIRFNNGKTVSELYTGKRVVQAFGMGNQFLVKFTLKNGTIVKSESNGVELKNGPDYIQADLEDVKSAVLSYDRSVNGTFYFLPAKTKADIQKEWDNIGKK